MRYSLRLTRGLGLLLVLSLAGLPQALAAGSSLSGSIVRGTDHTPMVGARLHVANPRTGEMFSSAPANREGGFSVSGLPAASYALAVEHAGGLYVVESALLVAQDSAQTLNLSVAPRGDLEQANFEQSDDSDNPGGFALWDNPLTAALVVLGIVVVIGVALDDDNDKKSSSPSMP